MKRNKREQRRSGWTLLLLFALAGAIALAWWGRLEDGLPADRSAATIGAARKEILRLLKEEAK